MKNVFSCSDFLSDLWQSGTDAAEGLGGLACVASEGGSTQLVRDASTDLLNLLEQAEEADSNSRLLSNLAASSSNRQDVPGIYPKHWRFRKLQEECFGLLRAASHRRPASNAALDS